MHIAPKRLFELQRGDDLAGVSKQQPQGCQLPRRKVKRHRSAKQGTIRFKPESGEEDGQLRAPKSAIVVHRTL
jgi:hypothetical protein